MGLLAEHAQLFERLGHPPGAAFGGLVELDTACSPPCLGFLNRVCPETAPSRREVSPYFGELGRDSPFLDRRQRIFPAPLTGMTNVRPIARSMPNRLTNLWFFIILQLLLVWFPTQIYDGELGIIAIISCLVAEPLLPKESDLRFETLSPHGAIPNRMTP